VKPSLLQNTVAIVLGCWVVAVLILYVLQYRSIIGIIARKFGLS